MEPNTVQIVAATLFAFAVLHTFGTRFFERLARRHPRHAGLFHLIGEVEVVFGFWALVLIIAMIPLVGGAQAVEYAESRKYTEPLFVFVIMVISASKPVLDIVQRLINALARLFPARAAIGQAWLGLALVPMLGSLITEPAAMTLAALTLAPQVFGEGIPERLKYAALGVLFVNVSIGGIATSYAAPPVLMIAGAWGWNTSFMALTFGWKAIIAVAVNASAVVFLLRKHISVAEAAGGPPQSPPAPLIVSIIHLAFLAAVVTFAHHPVIFVGLFLFFLGFTQAYERHQSPLVIKEGLLVGFFLAGLVVIAGMQQWWLQPIVSGLEPIALFFGALGLTAIADNAALTYLGSLIEGISDQSKYMLVSGAVAGGGLTIIANAPNPAGVALLRPRFGDQSIGAGGLLLGATPPTAVAALAFLLL